MMFLVMVFVAVFGGGGELGEVGEVGFGVTYGEKEVRNARPCQGWII